MDRDRRLRLVEAVLKMSGLAVLTTAGFVVNVPAGLALLGCGLLAAAYLP